MLLVIAPSGRQEAHEPILFGTRADSTSDITYIVECKAKHQQRAVCKNYSFLSTKFADFAGRVLGETSPTGTKAFIATVVWCLAPKVYRMTHVGPVGISSGMTEFQYRLGTRKCPRLFLRP